VVRRMREDVERPGEVKLVDAVEDEG